MFDVSVDNPASLDDLFGQVKLAAGLCYQPTVDKAREKSANIPVKDTLFDSGHHTTFQHSDSHVSFVLDQIPVSLATFGLHFTHPFYNTSQRSGRFCTEMFQPEKRADRSRYITGFISNYMNWPWVISNPRMAEEVIDWVESGISFFQQQLPEVTVRAKKALQDERPNFQGDLDRQASRIAQEQLRNLISTIVPTGMLYTVNLSTLCSMFLAAWNQPMKVITKAMLDAVAYHQPKFRPYISSLSEMRNKNVRPFEVPLYSKLGYDGEQLTYKPNAILRSAGMSQADLTEALEAFRETNQYTPFNLLPFHPSTGYTGEGYRLDADLKMSVATFGQYQRHRTITRRDFTVTKEFYVPPLLQHRTITDFAEKYNHRYWELCRTYGIDKMIHFIPYGSMVRFNAEADLKDWYHSISKRVCLNAQEEFWQVENQLTSSVFWDRDKRPGPPCTNGGKCREGKRYCGRDIRKSVQRRVI